MMATFKWGHLPKNYKGLVAIDGELYFHSPTCSECPKRISLSCNRKTCGMSCAINRELRRQRERREKKKDKDIFFWSYHVRNKQFTLYNYNRKSIAIFNSSGMLVTWWLGMSEGYRNKFSRINFGTKKKGRENEKEK